MTNTIRILKSAALVAVACTLSNCAAVKRGNYSPSFDPPAKPVTNPSALKVKLSTGAQRVYVMQGNEVLLATPCSVGTASSPTPLGNFTIYSKTANRRRVSSPGAGYPMTFWMEFKSAYGMHFGWVKPYPCTHGCVRLPIKAAQKIFAMVPTGTPLHIATSQPEDATIGRTLPVLDDSTLADPPDSYMLSPKVFEDAARGKIYNY
ncbi:MAG: L,D-transpeptidase [Verrucomicrobiaceae bacterium]|nr:L,D-transpeptidase [Verrucomicrobiaceae bacterium]